MFTPISYFQETGNYEWQRPVRERGGREEERLLAQGHGKGDDVVGSGSNIMDSELKVYEKEKNSGMCVLVLTALQQLRCSGCSLASPLSDGVPCVPIFSVPAAYVAVAVVLAFLLLLASQLLLAYLLCQALLFLASSLLLSSWLLGLTYFFLLIAGRQH